MMLLAVFALTIAHPGIAFGTEVRRKTAAVSHTTSEEVIDMSATKNFTVAR
jgi:hypothetical protein